jgi:hypothetical protein
VTRNYSARANISVKILLLVVSALVLLLSACTSDENEAFIQGNWFYNDQHIQEQIGETFSETYWSFDRGTYETYTCCFMKFQQYGRYDILESEGDKLVLELFNIDGKFNSERAQIAVTIDRQADTIRLLRAGPFTRMSP